MTVDYMDMLNHSFQTNCFFHWHFKDRMHEVMINAGQHIRKGKEMTVDYMGGQRNNIFMQRYGFSSPVQFGYQGMETLLLMEQSLLLEEHCPHGQMVMSLRYQAWKEKL